MRKVPLNNLLLASERDLVDLVDFFSPARRSASRNLVNLVNFFFFSPARKRAKSIDLIDYNARICERIADNYYVASFIVKKLLIIAGQLLVIAVKKIFLLISGQFLVIPVKRKKCSSSRN